MIPFAKDQSGFTLVELVVVVLIVGLLAGIAMPRLAKAWNDAKASACKANMKQIEAALELYYFEEGAYPTATEFRDDKGETQLKVKSLPVCPQSKELYLYKQTDTGYELECPSSEHGFSISETTESF